MNAIQDYYPKNPVSFGFSLLAIPLSCKLTIKVWQIATNMFLLFLTERSLFLTPFLCSTSICLALHLTLWNFLFLKNFFREYTPLFTNTLSSMASLLTGALSIWELYPERPTNTTQIIY